MHPTLLYRLPTISDAEERDALLSAFPPEHRTPYRTQVSPGSLVVGRYAVLPFYRELEYELQHQGSRLINSTRQHRWIADLGNYVHALGPRLTPPAEKDFTRLPERGPFVVKGETTSKKHKWRSHMYAETRADAIRIALELRDDGYINDQTLYARPFVKLRTFFNCPINGQPITDEHRFFVLDGKIVAAGYYWSTYAEDLPEVPDSERLRPFVEREVIPAVGDEARFYVVDVAVREDGTPIVIELNDGQMSGLSCIDPKQFYEALWQRMQDLDSNGSSTSPTTTEP